MHIPELYCPIPSSVVVKDPEAGEELIRWGADQGFFSLDSDAANLVRAIDIPLWTALAHPMLKSADDRSFLNRWWTWGAVFEMRFDTNAGQELDGFFEKFMDSTARTQIRILSNNPPLRDGEDFSEPMDRTLVSLLRETEQRFGNPWRSRISRSLLASAESGVWEARANYLSQTPDFDLYQGLRRHSYGQTYITDCAMMAMGIDAEAKFLRHPVIEHIQYLVALYGGFVNDLNSLDRDLYANNRCSSVIAYRHQYGVTLDEAIRAVVDMCNGYLRSVLAIEAAMPDYGKYSFDDQEADQIDSFFYILKMLMRGNIDWYEVSPRYNGGWKPGGPIDPAPWG
ncbi:terpene synthase family protein [Nocardia sp. NPDC059240]|uniref:terpene synthase family protein n=1 Tax=Nocardia sp. NPDC059240 TaxID=3346786 RepID=UPI0036946145